MGFWGLRGEAGERGRKAGNKDTREGYQEQAGLMSGLRCPESAVRGGDRLRFGGRVSRACGRPELGYPRAGSDGSGMVE